MKYEELETLVSTGDALKVAEALAPLSVADRRHLSVQTASLYKAVRFGIHVDERSGKEAKEINRRVMGKLKDKHNTVQRIIRACNVAVLGVCAWQVAKQANVMLLYNEKDDGAVLKVLTDRRPDWLQRWVEHKLDQNWIEIDWNLLRGLIKAGACEKPATEGYTRFFAQCMGNVVYYNSKEGYRPLSEQARAEPDLIEDIWRIFEVENDAFTTCWSEHAAAWREKAGNESELWPDTLLALMQSGHLDRGRLLDATLCTLSKGFKNAALSGTAKMHEALEPTDEEIATRQSDYLDLLSVQAGQVVTFAIKMLKRLAKAKTLDPALFLHSAGRVFVLTTKSQPMAILSMAKPLMKMHPEHRAAGVSLAFEGLTHANADVLSASLKLIAVFPNDAPGDAGEQLAALLDDFPATLRPDAEALLQALGGSEAEQVIEATREAEASGRVDTQTLLTKLRERVDALDHALRDRFSIDAALSAMEQSSSAPQLSLALMDAPVLSTLELIEPITSADELLDAAAHAVEQIESPDEVERLIDGVVRLCDQRVDEFGARMSPTLKRIMTSEQWAPFAPCEVPLLLLAWLAPAHNKKFGHGDSENALSFMSRRVREATEWVTDRRPRQLLSTPTHAGGWIDPHVFVQRLVDIEDKGLSIGRNDLILALLRLTPDRRDEALQAASKLRFKEMDAVRWALGGAIQGLADGITEQTSERTPTNSSKLSRLLRKVVGTSAPEQAATTIAPEDFGLWLAAGRCREPHAHLGELEAAGIQITAPGGTPCTEHTFAAKIVESEAYGRTYRNERMTIKTLPVTSTITRSTQTYCPTVLLYRKTSRWSYFGCEIPWALRWIESIWPMNNDPMLLAAIDGMIMRLDSNSSSWEPNHAMLHGLFMPDRPWNALARLAVWIALAGKDADARGVAMDALIEAIDDGRAHPDEMGKSLQTLSPRDFTDWLKLNRISENLGEVARVSDLHAWFVAATLQHLVATWDKPPRNAHHVLAVLLETLTRLGLAMNDDAVPVLAKIEGSSKTAKLARSLLQLAGDTSNPAWPSVLARQVEVRLERAEHWARAAVSSAASA